MSFVNGFRTLSYVPFRSFPRLQQRIEKGLKLSYYGLTTVFAVTGLVHGSVNGLNRVDKMYRRDRHNYGESLILDLIDCTSKTGIVLSYMTGGLLMGTGIGLTSPVSLPMLAIYNNTNFNQSSDNLGVFRKKLHLMNKVLHMPRNLLDELD